MHGMNMKVEDLLGDNTGEHDDDANVLMVAAMGNSIGKRTYTRHESRAFWASMHCT